MNDLYRLQVTPSTPVKEAMNIINDGGAQIALVVDEKQRLIGTLTDGDIRRALLKGDTLQTPIEKIVNRNYRSGLVGDDQNMILKMMREEVLRQIPILDDQGKVVELLLLQELLNPHQLNNAVVIMAGGRNPLATSYPKLSKTNATCWWTANA